MEIQIMKKKQAELDNKRKENLSLTFEKRKVDMELAAANRKIASLSQDMSGIHIELDKFASTFEGKLESAIIERDQTIQ